MSNELPKRDPIAAYVRKAAADRTTGHRQCVCGEKRPWALIRNGNFFICAECDRRQERKSVLDDHHPAGKANNPITIPTPVNDHRSELSVAQYDWPRLTRENPKGSPLLALAASIRGF